MQKFDKKKSLKNKNKVKTNKKFEIPKVRFHTFRCLSHNSPHSHIHTLFYYIYNNNNIAIVIYY